MSTSLDTSKSRWTFVVDRTMETRGRHLYTPRINVRVLDEPRCGVPESHMSLGRGVFPRPGRAKGSHVPSFGTMTRNRREDTCTFRIGPVRDITCVLTYGAVDTWLRGSDVLRNQ